MTTVSRHEDALQMYYLYTKPYDYDSLTVIMASRIVWSAFLLLIFVYNFKEINAQVSAVLYLTLCMLDIFCHASVVVCESFQNLFFYLKKAFQEPYPSVKRFGSPHFHLKLLLLQSSGLCVLMRARLFIVALWSPAGKWLTSWLLFVISNCEVVTFPLVSWVRCGA